MNKLWHVTSGNGSINEFVRAEDQFSAWDSLRYRDKKDFGMIVSAEPNENNNPFLIRTSMLMFRWGREDDAMEFIKTGVEHHGMPDTESVDRSTARI